MRMAEVEIIKASQIKREIAQNSHKLLKVAAYCRVSTDDDEQLESYKSQVSYYTKIIDENPEWQKVAIYADEAITGTMDSSCNRCSCSRDGRCRIGRPYDWQVTVEDQDDDKEAR